jgi:hypothetical protein
MRSPALRVAKGGRRLLLLRTVGRRVGESVSPEVAVSTKHFSALLTLVGLDVGVREEMRLEVGALVEAAAALRTLVRRVVQMEDPVHGQSARLTEAFPAIQTLERLLLRVNISIVRKSLSVKAIKLIVWQTKRLSLPTMRLLFTTVIQIFKYLLTGGRGGGPDAGRLCCRCRTCRAAHPCACARESGGCRIW